MKHELMRIQDGAYFADGGPARPLFDADFRTSVGRIYQLSQNREPGHMALLRAVKASLDPSKLMNAGALGL
jgi:hypothetical protein